MSSGGDKTEKPTARRLRDAAKRGQIALGRDLAVAVGFAGAVGMLVAAGPSVFASLAAHLRLSIERAAASESLDQGGALSALWAALLAFGSAAVPVACAALVPAALTLALQTRGSVTSSAFAPKPERFNPFSGLKRLVSVRSGVELAKTMVKLMAVGAAVASAVWSTWASLLDTSHVPGAMSAALSIAKDASLRAVAMLLALGAADLFLQRWLHERDLKMSKDDVKRDMKEDDGDPHVRHARKQLHRELATSSARAVRSATVVFANPTHVAAALKYDGDGTAPRVVAKGADGMALRIRREAELAGVPVIENRPLARALFAVALDDEIPEALYVGVAEILVTLDDLTSGPSGPASEAPGVGADRRGRS